jgi:hypothetical protein
VCPPLDFSRDQLPELPMLFRDWLITCDFNSQCLAFNWGFSSDRNYTVKVVNIHQQQDITEVYAPSVAFSHNGAELAVPVTVSGLRCIAIYRLHTSCHCVGPLLQDRREIFWPEHVRHPEYLGTAMPYMAFSPTHETLALASSRQVFFIDVIGKTFANCSLEYDNFDALALQYSPDGRFVVAAGNDLISDDDTRFDGFIYLFNENGNNLWSLDSGLSGERLPVFDTVEFSACSTRVACVAQATTDVYIVDVDSGHAHRLTLRMATLGIVFDPSGQRLVTVHHSSICIIDSMSGAKLHETAFFDSSLKIQAMSWPEECNEEKKAHPIP